MEKALSWPQSANSKPRNFWQKYGQYKSKTFDSKIQAMAWSAEIEQSLSPDAILNHKTLSDALLRYRDEVSLSKKGFRSETNRLNKFNRYSIAGIPFADLKPSHLYDWLEQEFTTLKSSSVNRYLNLLSAAVFEQAKRWRWTDKNIVRGIKTQEPQPRDRRISPTEIERILDVLAFDGNTVKCVRDELAIGFLLAIETAMRQGEWQLTWDNVFLEKRFVRLHETKKGTRRDVPLFTEATRLFTLLAPHSKTKVFSSNK